MESAIGTDCEGWKNIHIPATKPDMEFHKVVARLVGEYTPSGGSVLDLGAGLGNVLRMLGSASPVFELHAADVSDECLRVLDETLPGIGLHTITECHDSIAKLGSNRFDTCIMCHTLEHTLNPLDTLHTALDIVKPNGCLILAVPNPVCPLCFGWSAVRYNYANRGHVCSWDRPHWENFLENIAQVHVELHTQDEVRVFPQRVSRRMWPLKFFERRLANVFPWWSHSHISVIRGYSPRKDKE